jgi:hypothetical protein
VRLFSEGDFSVLCEREVREGSVNEALEQRFGCGRGAKERWEGWGLYVLKRVCVSARRPLGHCQMQGRLMCWGCICPRQV